jgi:hypothetical protein
LGINYGILLLFTLGILLPLFIDKSSYEITSKKTSIAKEEIIINEINTKTIISTGPLSSEINN